MNVVKSEKMFCSCCNEEHEVKTVLVLEEATLKNTIVKYEAAYLFCENANEYFMTEQQFKSNDVKLKDAYKKQEGLLTSSEIIGIRKKYKITQTDLCLLLGWGGKTITRYESYQIQDKAHDTILKKIDQDPEWFISLINEAKDSLPADSYDKYIKAATEYFKEDHDAYLRKAIEANYAKYHDRAELQGNATLSLDKVVDVIKYFASSKVLKKLHKVRLMKLMWYADALAFKMRGYSITGLVYEALQWGAVPVGHSSIMELEGVPCEKVETEDGIAYEFSLAGVDSFPFLSTEEVNILDTVVKKLGKMDTSSLVDFMHSEEAYIETKPREAIDFIYTKNLKI